MASPKSPFKKIDGSSFLFPSPHNASNFKSKYDVSNWILISLTFKAPNTYHFLQILDQCAADSNFGSQMDFLNLHEYRYYIQYMYNREMGEPKSAAYPLPQKFEFQRWCYWNVLRHFKGISTHYIRITWTCCCSFHTVVHCPALEQWSNITVGMHKICIKIPRTNNKRKYFPNSHSFIMQRSEKFQNNQYILNFLKNIYILSAS